jgi:hypothetical protein
MENMFLLKEIRTNTFARALLGALLFVSIFLSAPSDSYGKEVMSEPIVEGRSVAGLTIGDTEDKVISLISKGSFKLNHVDENPETNDKVVTFGNMTELGGLGITVFLRNGRVFVIEVISAPIKGTYPYKGKTKKGFSFGDTFQKVEKLYGKPQNTMAGIHLYNKEGIAFAILSGGEVDKEKPNMVFIMPPGSDIDLNRIFQR